MGVKTTKIRKFAWNHKGELEISLFSIYITQITPLENGNNEICFDLPLFSQKMWVKTTKIRRFAWTHKGELEMSLFFQ